MTLPVAYFQQSRKIETMNGSKPIWWRADALEYRTAPFPLTPALSLWERVPRIPTLEQSELLGWLNTRATIPPLPTGEGWGEGEADALGSQVCDIPGTFRPGESRGRAGGFQA